MLRMVMLYALRYESHSNNDVSGLVDALRKRGVSIKGMQRGFVINGETADDLVGMSISSAGDVNGDGLDDLISNHPSHHH
jgi:hypothetical protein